MRFELVAVHVRGRFDRLRAAIDRFLVPDIVGFLVELPEEVVEENRVGQDDDHRPLGVVAIVEEHLGVVDEGEAELALEKRRNRGSDQSWNWT